MIYLHATCPRARNLAEEFFDADKVLKKMLSDIA
jgi:hypothetical protein